MKKWIIVLLCLTVIVGSLSGCSGETGEQSAVEKVKDATFETLAAGFGKVDVTPTLGVHLGSYGNADTRTTTGVKDNFYALTTALTDPEGNTLILIVTDLSWGYYTWSEKVREAVTEKYDIPGEHVMLGGTHNHNGPVWEGKVADYAINKEYLANWLEGVLESVDMAMADRSPVTSLEVGRTETEGLGFVRRYWREDGNFWGSGGGSSYYVQSDSPIVRYESEGDEEVQLVKISREEGKDILIGQWQNHGCHIGDTTIAATDWIGPMREKVEEELDVHYLYMQGAAGNMTTISKIKSDYPVSKTADQVGEEVADYIVTACKTDSTFSKVKVGNIVTKQENFTETKTSYGANSWTGELNTLGIGELAIVTFPVEVFAESGMKIKEQSPYAMTLLMGYTNGIHGYIPTREAYENGGYEADSRGWADTAERFVDTYLKSLNELYAKK